MPSSIAVADRSGAGRVLTAVGEVEGVVVRAARETVSERNLEMGPEDDEGTMLLGSGREVLAVYRLLGGTDMLDCRFHQTLAIGMFQAVGWIRISKVAICDARWIVEGSLDELQQGPSAQPDPDNALPPVLQVYAPSQIQTCLLALCLSIRRPARRQPVRARAGVLSQAAVDVGWFKQIRSRSSSREGALQSSKRESPSLAGSPHRALQYAWTSYPSRR